MKADGKHSYRMEEDSSGGGMRCKASIENGSAPHVLASRKGEGPPMAPPGWRWTTGKRAQDICFIAPSGERLRSRVALLRFLQNFPNPPSPHEFLWRVSSSDFENIPLPGLEMECHASRYARTLSKGTKKQRGDLKSKSKIQHHQTLQCNNGTFLLGDSSISGNSTTSTGVDIEQDIVIEIPVSQGQKRKRPLRQKLKVCQFCSPLGHKLDHHVAVEHHGEGHHEIEHHLHASTPKKGRTHYNYHTSVSDDEITLINLLKEHRKEDGQFISNHSECLHEAAKVVQAFLTKTGELKETGAIDVDELRKILLNLPVTREIVKTFPIDVLNAFVLITRNEAAPPALGRRALIRLSTKWFCKYKRYWCLLEEHRINSVIQKFLHETRSLDPSYLCQKSNAWKRQCMVDPFVESHHVGKQNADLVLQTSSKPEDSFSTESSKTLCQGGSCYKSKPCRECKQYQAIRDAFTNFLDKKSVTYEGLLNWGGDSGGNTVATERQKEASSLLMHKTIINDSSIYAGNEADRKYENLSNNESVATQAQKVGDATVDPQFNSRGELFDVTFQVDTANGHSDNTHSTSNNRCLDRINGNSSGKLCNCNSCLDVHFCRGCMCYVCHLSIEPEKSWSYIKCSCYHVFHLECIIMERNGGVVEEKKIDAELLCPVCKVKSDLFPFWRERLKNASETESKDTLQKHLKSAISAIDGTRRKSLKALNCRVLKVYESVTYTTCSDLQQLLVSILEDVKIQKMSKKLEGLLDRTFQIKEYELLEAQKLVNLSRRVADEDIEIYQKSQELVATQKELLAQAKENLKNAEVEMRLANENAKFSAGNARKARKRLELLQLNYKPPSITKEQVEVQQKLYEQEVSELRKIQRMIGSVNCCCEQSLPELRTLLESMKLQRKKVEVALRKMERMASLCDS